MRNKGFFLLESLLVFSLGITLMLACLRTSKACLVTMQKKVLLEEAIIATELYLAQRENSSKLEILTQEQTYPYNDFTLKELQVKHENKTIFSMATIQ